eukprot:25450_1
MTGKNHKNNWYLLCSGMELYGDLMDSVSGSVKDTVYAQGGAIYVISESAIINYGEITSNGAIGGFINIKCTAFKNFGRIESKNKGRIAIQCASFATVSDIHPKPVINTPWQYLILDTH